MVLRVEQCALLNLICALVAVLTNGVISQSVNMYPPRINPEVILGTLSKSGTLHFLARSENQECYLNKKIIINLPTFNLQKQHFRSHVFKIIYNL